MRTISLSAITKPGAVASNDLSFLVGRWDTDFEVKLTKPPTSIIRTGNISFTPSYSHVRDLLPQINPVFRKAEEIKNVYELQWFFDPKDALMDTPEVLAQLYQEAEEEDRLLAQLGINHYVETLKQEDNE
ncbi:MAG: hypothetical protein FOGNACKC_00746 [Anaerolineae bacterium]|nr:hypothetical protein [Anaerolineae bacterium]